MATKDKLANAEKLAVKLGIPPEEINIAARKPQFEADRKKLGQTIARTSLLAACARPLGKDKNENPEWRRTVIETAVKGVKKDQVWELRGDKVDAILQATIQASPKLPTAA